MKTKVYIGSSSLREGICRRLFRPCHQKPESIIPKFQLSWRTKYQNKLTSFFSDSNFDLVTALDLATPVIYPWY